MVTLRAEVDEDTCMSSGKCVADAPTAFRFDADEIAQAIDGASSLDRAELMSVVHNCPAEAIRLYDGQLQVEAD